MKRRDFLKHATVASSAFALASPRTAWAGSANDRLNLAFVGLGGMGLEHLKWFRQQDDVRVVALCDVDASHLAGAAGVARDADIANDFRDVVAADIDAVVVATPDHWHGLVAVAAAKAGKHVYCEKPLANSIGESRAIVNAVDAAGVVLQTGSHERSNPGASVAKRLIAEGKLGEIEAVRINLPNSDAHLQEVENFAEAPPNADPPAGLDYDFWLGHTPASPYNEKRCHFWWRFHSRYGGGEVTDRGAHVVDLAHMILGLDGSGPVRVEAEGTPPVGGFYDAFVKFNFETRYASGLRMTGGNDAPRGVTFEGTEGKLFVAVHGCALRAEPEALLEGVELQPVNPYAIHRRQWVEAIRGGETVVAPASAGHSTATACHLNNLAIRVGRGFDWDPVAETSSDDEVNRFLTPSMRPPWSLEA